MKVLRLVIFFTVIIGLLVAFSYVLTINKIDCVVQIEQENASCPESVLTKLEPFYGTSLLDEVSFENDHVTKEFKVLSVQKKVPGNLLFTFEPEKIIYKIDLEKPMYVTESGFVYTEEQNQDKNIPTLEFQTNISLDEFEVPEEIHSSTMRILSELAEIDIEVNRIIWESDQKVIVLSNLGKNLILNPQTKKSLDLILSQLLLHEEYKENESTTTEIDLRFSHLILR